MAILMLNSTNSKATKGNHMGAVRLQNTQGKLHTRLVVILWKSQFGPRKMRVKAHIFMLNLPFILLHILCMLFMLWAFAPFGCCQKLQWAKNQNKNLVKMSYLVSILETKHLRISFKKNLYNFFSTFSSIFSSGCL